MSTIGLAWQGPVVAGIIKFVLILKLQSDHSHYRHMEHLLHQILLHFIPDLLSSGLVWGRLISSFADKSLKSKEGD